MSNKSKGARLWLRPSTATRPATWVIRDGGLQRGTGCGPLDRNRAEQLLAEYIAKKYAPPTNSRHPANIPVADVITAYVIARRGKVSRPKALNGRMRFLLGYFGTFTLAQLNPGLYTSYAEYRGSEQAARRELEDLRAAIRAHWRAGLSQFETPVTLPDKAVPRERWLTRDEAARLLRAAWREPRRRHVARFILVGLYTGTRAAAICSAAFQPAIGRGWVDLDHGVFYRLAQGKRQTNKRQTTIRIPPRLVAHLRRWREHGLSTHSVVEYEGKPVLSVKKGFKGAVEDAGLERVTQHTLRHTAITWALQNGADLYDASDYFGVSWKIMLSVYGHHSPEHQDGVGRAVTGWPQLPRNK